MKVVLEVNDVSVSYGEAAPALRQISLSLHEHELVAVLGANGAGKSTLLRAISGLVPLRGGRIYFQGNDIAELSPSKRVGLGIVHVPEGRQMLQGLTVHENLLLGAYVRKREPMSAIYETEQEIYQLFPILEERKNQLAGSLSGGQQQMLALGRALMSKPRILMCDEPSLGIAPIVVTEIFSSIAQLRDGGVPVLLVEQNAKKALALADRAVVMQRGEIKLAGPARDVASNEALSAAYLSG
jgi:branched-chain amino acid transport system ATP-binding protein